MDGNKGDKVAFAALLVLVWLAAAWWALKQLPYMTDIERTYFINRSAMCLLVYSVFIAYYVWRSFKPAHWTLRDYDGYEYPSMIELPNHWSHNLSRYKQIVKARLRLIQ